MFKLLPMLCLAVVVANAYDFSDTYFNQFLFEEYEFLNTDTLSRHRRHAEELPPAEKQPATEATPLKIELPETVTEQAPLVVEVPIALEVVVPVEIPAPVPIKPLTQAAAPAVDSSQCGERYGEMKKDLICCNANKHHPAYFSMIRGTKKECALKLRTNNPDVENFDPFNCQHMDKIKELITCESECVAKTLNMLDEQGNIKREAIIENFKKQVADVDALQIEALESYVDKCLEKIKDTDTKPANKCSRAAMEFQHCMFGEMVVGCPAVSQINTPRCQKIRERYSKGESLALSKHALHDFFHHSKRVIKA